MRSYKLDEVAIKILKSIAKGQYQAQISIALKLKKQTLYSRINSLIKNGYIQKGQRTTIQYLKLTDRGVKVLGEEHRLGVDNLYFKDRNQRPHAMQVNAMLFKTSWGRLEPTLEAIGIPYKKELKGNAISFNWIGIRLKATSHYLYTFIELQEMPLNVPIEEVKAKAIQEAGLKLEAFINKSGMRCIRDSLGNLALEVHYWENGYPANEIAEESLKDKSRIVYAYDKANGQIKAWADSSLGDLKELETNSETVDTEMKAFIQAVENREIRPYDDEITTRKHIKEIYELIGLQAKESATMAKNLTAHIPYLQAINRIAEQLDASPSKARRLRQALADEAEAKRQKRLFE